MKRNLYLTLIIGLILFPSFCGAAYLIEFKSGSKFITSHYWTTGNQVHFIFAMAKGSWDVDFDFDGVVFGDQLTGECTSRGAEFPLTGTRMA